MGFLSFLIGFVLIQLWEVVIIPFLIIVYILLFPIKVCVDLYDEYQKRKSV